MPSDSEMHEEFLRGKTFLSPEEARAAILSMAQPSDVLLELRYDETTRTVLILGNQEGLEYLLSRIATLVSPNAASGNHDHFEENSGFRRSDLRLIIERYEEGEVMTHRIE